MASRADRATRLLVHGFLDRYPDEAAGLLEARPEAELVQVLAAEPTPSAVRVLERLTPDAGARALAAMPAEAVRRLVPALDPGRAATLLARLEEPVRRQHLALLAAAVVRELEALMTYPPDSTGHLMDPRVPTFRPETTARAALGRLRGPGRPRLDDIFLVDEDGRLVGTVALHDLALAAPPDRLGGLARPIAGAVHVLATREEVVEQLTSRRLPSLPVVDLEGRLLGAIRHDALVAAVQAEASVDIQTMVGASKEERALSKVAFAVRKRLPWLEINLLTAFLAAAVVGLFEDTIARFTALAVLLPVVAGQSGNTGAQALAVTMRGLALREIRLHHFARVAVKEVNVAFLNGVVVALTTSLGVYVWSRSLGLALVIGLSMIISMVAAGLSGASVPMALTALGQDPAQSSSIVLTTVTDVVGFLSFLGIATLLAGML